MKNEIASTNESQNNECNKACKNGDMKLKAATKEEAHRLTAQQNLQEAQAQILHDLKKWKQQNLINAAGLP